MIEDKVKDIAQAKFNNTFNVLVFCNKHGEFYYIDSVTANMQTAKALSFHDVPNFSFACKQDTSLASKIAFDFVPKQALKDKDKKHILYLADPERGYHKIFEER